MNKKGIFWGLVLIFAAVYLLLNKMGLFTELPFFKVVCTIIFAYTLIQGCVHVNFYEIFFSIALLCCVYSRILGITAITPWPVLVAALLLGAGFSLIFKRPAKPVYKYTSTFESNNVVSCPDGETVHFSNNFGSSSKYINSDAFTRANIKNSFGECNVYFNNAILKNGQAEIHVSNNFGETNLFIPRTWRVQVKSKSFFGEVRERSMTNSDMDAPFAMVLAETNFGEINIYYE